MKIIITDAHSRKAFDLINILKKVYKLELLLFSNTGTTIRLPLIYKQKVHQLRSDQYSSFKKDLETVLYEYRDEKLIYIPVSEKETILFYEFLEEDHTLDISSLLPKKKYFELTRNKKRFQKFCEDNSLPVPRSYNQNNFHSLAEDFHPVIAKMSIGAGSVGMKYVDTVDDLKSLEELDHNNYLIQEKIQSANKIHGGFFLCKNGSVHGYYGHRRIRTFPETGGVTVYSKADYNQELKELGSTLLEKLNWDGIAMIEFMYDKKSEQWKIIELNPRLWGSIMLSEFCRSSLLINYIRLCQGYSVSINNLDTDTYIRWIFPFDLISLLKGKISMSEFLNLERKKTCYINFTYSSTYSSILYLFYFSFNIRSVKRFFKKIFS